MNPIETLCQRLDEAAERHPYFDVYRFADGRVSAGGATKDGLRELRALLRQVEYEMDAAGLTLPNAGEPESRVLAWLLDQPTARPVGEWVNAQLQQGETPEYETLTDNVFRSLALALRQAMTTSDNDTDKLAEVYQRAKRVAGSLQGVLHFVGQVGNPLRIVSPKYLTKMLAELPDDIGRLEDAIREAGDLLPRDRVEIAGHWERNLPAALAKLSRKLLSNLQLQLDTTREHLARRMAGEVHDINAVGMVENWDRLKLFLGEGIHDDLHAIDWDRLRFELASEHESATEHHERTRKKAGSQVAAAAFLRAYQHHLASLPPEKRATECLRRLAGAELPKGMPDKLRREWNAALAKWNAANAAECSALLEREAADWEVRLGESYPMTLEAWTELAAFAGVPAGDLLRGDWTPAAVEPIIRGVLRRMKADQWATGQPADPPAAAAKADDFRAFTEHESGILQELALDEIELRMLKALWPVGGLKQYGLARAAQRDIRTVAPSIRRMESAGLIGRPNGERKGYHLTDFGRRYVTQITG